MEGLKSRSYFLAGVLGLAGLVSLMGAAKPTGAKITEDVMEQLAPKSVAGYQVVPGPEGLDYTYKMDEGTYTTLHPFGIVARQYSGRGESWDVVLISSDSHESFHDPKICFSGQGWTFKSTREETLDLEDGRRIPMTVVEMLGPSTDSFAAYFYHGPKGYVANPKRLQLDMFSEVLFGHKPMTSTFYRFMPVASGQNLADMKQFIKTYMTAAKQESSGFF